MRLDLKSEQVISTVSLAAATNGLMLKDQLLSEIQYELSNLSVPPFTIQRLCEVLNHPHYYYTHLVKFLRAVLKLVSVSTCQTNISIEDRKLPSDDDLIYTKPQTPLITREEMLAYYKEEAEAKDSTYHNNLAVITHASSSSASSNEGGEEPGFLQYQIQNDGSINRHYVDLKTHSGHDLVSQEEEDEIEDTWETAVSSFKSSSSSGAANIIDRRLVSPFIESTAPVNLSYSASSTFHLPEDENISSSVIGPSSMLGLSQVISALQQQQPRLMSHADSKPQSLLNMFEDEAEDETVPALPKKRPFDELSSDLTSEEIDRVPKRLNANDDS
jgi:PPP4R2